MDKQIIKEWVRDTITTRTPYNVTIKNLTASFADGLAFAALVHCLCRDHVKKLPTWDTITTSTPYERLTWAFAFAEKQLHTAPLLDAVDTIGYQDQKSIMLYLNTMRTAVGARTGSPVTQKNSPGQQLLLHVKNKTNGEVTSIIPSAFLLGMGT